MQKRFGEREFSIKGARENTPWALDLCRVCYPVPTEVQMHPVQQFPI